MLKDDKKAWLVNSSGSFNRLKRESTGKIAYTTGAARARSAAGSAGTARARSAGAHGWLIEDGVRFGVVIEAGS